MLLVFKEMLTKTVAYFEFYVFIASGKSREKLVR